MSLFEIGFAQSHLQAGRRQSPSIMQASQYVKYIVHYDRNRLRNCRAIGSPKAQEFLSGIPAQRANGRSFPHALRQEEPAAAIMHGGVCEGGEPPTPW